MGRTIIETATAGWYEDPATGKKTRKQDGDNIVTRAEYDQMLLDAEDGKTTPEPVNGNGNGQVEKPEAEVKVLTTNKVAVGKTVELRCAWVDPDKRTDAQQALFASNFKGLRGDATYDAVKAAADNKRSAMPDGRVHVRKVQDAFQARFHPDNQKKWRAELRRNKTKVRAQAARQAAKS